MILLIATITGILGALLTYYAIKQRKIAEVNQTANYQLVEKINALLPQTQCAQCGYPGCKPYAEAIANGVPINQCPPGGEATIEALASLLGESILPLNTAFGSAQESPYPRVALIREEECIGCAKCLEACPVDAILGTNKMMHTVIAAECTGCDLCLPPCPVDCIEMIHYRQPIPFKAI